MPLPIDLSLIREPIPPANGTVAAQGREITIASDAPPLQTNQNMGLTGLVISDPETTTLLKSILVTMREIHGLLLEIAAPKG